MTGKYSPIALLPVVMLCGSLTAGAAAGAMPAGPRMGEVRAIAVGQANHDAVDELHRDGWLEANGQLLITADFDGLFRQIGRTWTAEGVAAQYFAVPDLRKGIASANEPPNPYGVLGPGDLVQSGRPQRTWERAHVISYWIFTGRDVSHVEAIHLK